MTKTYGNFTDFVDFSRSSSATYLGSDGLIKTAANNIPRVEYDANGVVKGLLIEEARTNLLTGSDASSWVTSGTVTLTDQTDLSLGIFTGVKVASGGQNWHRVNEINLSVTSGVAYACTLFYKAGTSGKVFMNLRDGTNSTETRIGGTIGSCTVLQEFAGTAEILSEELIGGEVYSLQVKFTPNATITTLSFGGGPWSNTAGQDVIILGGQLEAGSFPTSYIPTTGATATRAADIASIATANFGYNKAAGTVVVEAIPTRQLAGTMVNICDSGSGGTIERMQLRFQSTTVQAIFASSGVADGSSTTGHSLSVGDTTTGAFTFKGANTLTTAQAGTVGTTDTSHLVPTPVELRVGRLGATEFLNGHIKSIKYLPRRLTNTQLQEQTA